MYGAMANVVGRNDTIFFGTWAGNVASLSNTARLETQSTVPTIRVTCPMPWQSSTATATQSGVAASSLQSSQFHFA
jgi:hypothetical protein